MAKDPSKTEEATPKKLNKTRGEGSVAKSQELTKAITLLAGVIALVATLGYVGRVLQGIFRFYFTEFVSFSSASSTTDPVSAASIMNLLLWTSGELAKMLLPILIIIGLSAYIILRLQVGKLWTTKVFKFKLSKFNPINGLKRMFFSLQTFVRLGKTLLQALFIGLAPIIVIRKEFPFFITLYEKDVNEIIAYILSICYQIVKYALYPMFAIAIFDWWYSKWEYKENIKMSKDEVKDEHKQSEGDPEQRSRMRQKMMQMSAKRMLQDVPKADVVITNPTHIAVALKYDIEEAPAPIVVAIGVNVLAEKIKTIAKENRVPIRQNVPLARALHKQTKVGDTIPPELFQAVALILAQIWKNDPQKRNRKK